MPSSHARTLSIAALTVATVALLTVTPAGQALVAGATPLTDLVDRARDCQDKPMPDRPPAEVDATLDDLADVYDDLPGFVDVYYVPVVEPAYRAVFEGEVPDAAADRDPGQPVAFHVVPALDRDQADPVEAPTPQDVTCGGIRPGAWASGCTTSFVFQDGQGDLYIGSAGHCFSVGDRVDFHDVGRAGTVVYAGEPDFALIDIDDDQEHLVSPELCVWGGPTGTNDDAAILGDEVVSDGHGRIISFPFARSLPPRPRAGVGLFWGANTFTWSGSMMGGDSGAAVQERGGEALGTHVRSLPGPDALAIGTRWDAGLEPAEDELNVDLSLVTSGDVHLQPDI